MSIFDSVLAPLEWGVAWLMVGFHTIFTSIGLPEAAGYTWALSIVGLVIVIGIILIPLFVKTIHSQRRMQFIQPEMQKIQKKYKGKTDPESRQAMTQETMGLYKRTGNQAQMQTRSPHRCQLRTATPDGNIKVDDSQRRSPWPLISFPLKPMSGRIPQVRPSVPIAER